ncbi:MAG: leucine-rich repeat protein [Bacteroidaceae bacterium]|nr:leucine-rich repeat protein [Bacteroidaceae bacterium]
MDESLQYSVGDGAWTKLTAGTEISFGGQGKDLRLRGQSSTGTAVDPYQNFSTISFENEEVPVACTGDIRTLVDYLNYSNASTVDARFCNLFSECIQLTSAPELPATTLAEYCYSGMFTYCIRLTEAPALPATTLAKECYSNMFEGCTSLNTVPTLPAEALAESCYSSMFKGCTSLTTAPALPAETLAAGCYSGMFRVCKNLKNVTMLATDISAESCLSYWLYEVAKEGTFTKAAEMTSLPSGNGDASIPNGWIV